MSPRRLGLCFAAGLVLRLALAPLPGFRLDVAAFESWALALVAAGPGAIYTTPLAQPPVDYPPLYLYVLWLAGSLQAHVGAASARPDVSFRYLIKLPAIVADLAAAALVFRFGARIAGARPAEWASTAVLLAPPTWLVSAYWGQVDAVPAALLLGAALLSLERRWSAAWLLVAAAVLVKPQGVVLVPVFFARQVAVDGFGPRALRRLAAALASGVALAYAVCLPFAPNRTPAAALAWLGERYAHGVAKAPHNSEGAFNLYTVTGGFYRSDATPFLGVPLHAWGVLLVGAAVVLVSVRLYATTRRAASEREATLALAYAAALALGALFLFGTRMHERYLLAALLFGAVVTLDGAWPAAAVAALALSFCVDCAFVLAGFSGGAHHPVTVGIGHVFSALNLAAFAVLAGSFWRRTSVQRRSSSRTSADASARAPSTR